jgi:hypothetical protein
MTAGADGTAGPAWGERPVGFSLVSFAQAVKKNKPTVKMDKIRFFFTRLIYKLNSKNNNRGRKIRRKINNSRERNTVNSLTIQ